MCRDHCISCLLCQSHIYLVGDIVDLLGDISRFEHGNWAGTDQLLVMRWTCPSLVTIWQIWIGRQQAGTNFHGDGKTKPQSPSERNELSIYEALSETEDRRNPPCPRISESDLRAGKYQCRNVYAYYPTRKSLSLIESLPNFLGVSMTPSRRFNHFVKQSPRSS